MSKFVVLNIDEGNFEEGFRVSLGIGENGPTYYKDKIKLPPAPDVPRLYQDWQNRYCELGETIRQINIPSTQVTNCSIIEDESQARKILENYLREWFAQLPWRELRVRIEERTQPKDLIRVIIDTNNIYLKKLPWHLWKLFHNRPYAEFALSAEYAPPTEALQHPVKILAIFGGSKGLDLNSDRDLIAKLRSRGAKVTWLEKPDLSELSESLWGQHWDILFFAGHSSSGEECKTGEIQINDSESISLNLLRNSLRVAVNNGLKLAIFNSCDGLGLADELIGVKVPQMIVMREPVPDEVARQFLKYFLDDFSQGHSLYLAVRNARQRLEWMEKNFPCASWLPVICQNPAAHPLLWSKAGISIKKIAVIFGLIIGAFVGYQVFNEVIFYRQIERTKQDNILQDLGDRFSWGEKIIIRSNDNKWKQKGIEAFKQKKYELAIDYFEKSLQQNKNDPETRIYLNNAISMQPLEDNKCNIVNQNPIRIAVVAPSFRNTQNQINEELLRGVSQAQHEINLNCGIQGRLLQIIIVDDNDDAKISVKVAEQLVNQQNILAIVGHYSSSATLKAGQIYDKKQMVLISPSSTAVRSSPNKDYGIKLNKYVFRTTSNDEIAIKNLVNYITNKLGYKKAAIVYDSSGVYSKKFREELKNQLESPEINGDFIDIKECDLFSNASIVNCLKKANKTVEVLAIVPETSRSFNKALEILDSNQDSNLTLLGGDSLYSRTVKNKGNKARNLIVAVPWFQNEEISNQSEFESNVLELWNTQASWRTAMSYDATMAIAEGLKRMNGKLNRAELQKVLSASNFSAPGAFGTVEFENGERKITTENQNQIGVLVKIECNTARYQGCKFVRVPEQ